MAKPPQNKSPAKARVAPTAHGIQQPGVMQLRKEQTTTQVYQGPVPHPEILERFEALVPGTAQRMFQQAADESAHRRQQEDKINNGNIAAQAKQLQLSQEQTKSVFRSDLVGQIAGVVVAIASIGGAVYLALNDKQAVAAALSAIPTAAVIQAFFAKKPTAKP